MVTRFKNAIELMPHLIGRESIRRRPLEAAVEKREKERIRAFGGGGEILAGWTTKLAGAQTGRGGTYKTESSRKIK
jgi:hypothetical protein